jgi:hypothetical protein
MPIAKAGARSGLRASRTRWRAHYLLEPLLYSRLASGEGPDAAKLLRRLAEHGE